MSYIYVWLAQVIGTLFYCMLAGPRVIGGPVQRIFDVAWWGGMALLCHWIVTKFPLTPRRKS